MYFLLSRLSLLLSLIIFSSALFSQTGVNFGRQDVNQLAPRLRVDGPSLAAYAHADIPAEYLSQMTDRTALRFADETARGAASILQSGRVYNGWQEMEDYVNKVLQNVLPEDLRGKEFVRAYVIKDGSPNAFMTPSGMFFINIGMIAEIESESSLAGIIGHEIAHYELRHSLEGFVRRESGAFDPGIFFNSRKAISSFSIENELDSDALAADHLQKAGYQVGGLADAFNVFKLQEDKRLLQLQDVWEIKETTHPNSTSRIEKINEIIAAQSAGEVRDRTEDEALFQKLKEEAKAEVLKYLLAGFAYQTCLEKAFAYHIFEPENPTFVYYAMEAIRRSCYLDATLWNKKFLADKYYDVVEVKGSKRKVPIEGHFFDRFRPEILSLTADDYQNIRAKFYWDGPPKFTTYEGAYQFFYRIGKLLKEPECELSNALSLSFDPAQRDKFLRAYLAYEDVRHRDFATALLEGEIFAQLKKRKLTMFHQFLPIIKHGVDDIVLWNPGEEARLQEALEQAVTSFPDRDFLYLGGLRKTNINDYLLLANLEGFSQQYLVARGEKTELHLLDPGYWEAMKRFGANRFEFVNCLYNDRAKGAFTAAVYQEISSLTFSDILGKPEEKGRYVKMFLSGIQISEEGPMKLRAYDGSDKLATKGTGYALLGALLQEKLEDLDKSVD